MTFVVALVALLVGLAGVIAYAGDRLGTWVGRRRLTLFGARPKRTGQIVGVAAGILIMLTTLGVLALAFRSATTTLLNAQRTAEQLVELQAQERALQGQVRDLTREQVGLEADLVAAEAARLAAVEELGAAVDERAVAQSQVDALLERTDALVVQLAALEAETAELERAAAGLSARATELQIENVGLQARNDQLVTSNAELAGRNLTLQELNDRLQAEILAGNEEVRGLQDQVGVLSDRLEDQARRLVEAQQEFARASSGEVTFARDQVVFAGAIAARDLAEAREELAAFVRAATEHTARLGAGEVVLSAEQFAALAEAIVETEGSDLIRLISPTNQFNPARVEVIVEALENSRLFDAGHLVMSRRIHVGTPELPATQDEVRGWIAQLKAEVVRYLRRSGLDELQAPVFVGSSDEGFANQLMRLSGSVVIGVVTRDPVDRAGPAYVELMILY